MPLADYPLGYSASEQARLELQSKILKPITTRLLLEAGLKPGMKVLDLGCGPGDVSMLISQLIGPKGRVIGIDVDQSTVSVAHHRAERAGYKNIEFYPTSLEVFSEESEFDFVMGRYVLMFQPQPEQFLRQAYDLLRPGGKIAFHEVDLIHRPISTPDLPLFNFIVEQNLETFKRTLTCYDVALRLGSLFHSVAIGNVGTCSETPVQAVNSNDICRVCGETFLSLYPETVEIQLPSQRVIKNSDLVNELTQECLTAGARVEFLRQIGAWGEKIVLPESNK